MSEKGPGISTGKDTEPGKALETKHTVKDTWFNAYVEANASVPQADTAIDIYLLDAVLRDLPIDWTTFAESEFSPEQIKRISEIMSRVHAGLSVPYATVGHHHHFKDQPVNFVFQDRIQKLWTRAKNNLIVNLYWSVIPFGGARPNVTELDSFFKNSQNHEEVIKLINIFGIIKRAHKDKEAQALLKTYREQLILNPKRDQTGLLRAKLNEVIRRELASSGLNLDDSFIKNVITLLRVNE